MGQVSVNRILLPLVLMVAGLGLSLDPARAQLEPGKICVSTYADTNGNGIRDPGETGLAGVNINLSTGGVIIATHITTNSPEYCFENLLSGIYIITFTDSPTYRATTASEGTFALESGQRLTVNEFGAFPVALTSLRAEVAAQIAANSEPDKPLATSTRLVLATSGSMLVMLFMIGIGAVILGLVGGRRDRARHKKQTQSIRPPTEIKPPFLS